MLPKFLKPKVKLKLIRVGSSRDGGYFVPKKIISKIDKIIALGLGSDWSFEEQFIKKKNSTKIVFYDHTINKLFWTKLFLNTLYFALRYKSSYIDLFKYFSYKSFFKKNNIDHKKLKISPHTNLNRKNISINDVLKKEKGGLLLKIDIEGDEYKVINQIAKYQKIIYCLIIEFHEVNKNLKKINKFLKKIRQLVNCNISSNNSFGFDKNKNPYVFEIVLINKKFLKKKDYTKAISLKSFPNNPYKINFEITFEK